MPDYVLYIGFAVSLIFVVVFSLLVGRKVFKSGIEHFSSRILIFSCIIDASLCSLLFLLQGAIELHSLITSASFSPGKLIIPVVFLVVPCKIVWNYFAIQRKLIAQFNLTPHVDGAFSTTMTSLAKTMGISAPEVLSSESVSMPFVFGLRSSNAILAIPQNWRPINDSQHIQLMHELAHIRNHDVDFLAWSNACLRDLRLMMILLPALVIYSIALGYSYMVSSICLFLACSLILFILLKFVIRKRELLADLTAAMLVESGRVKTAISNKDAGIIRPDINIEQQAGPKLADKILRWLTDKALFSKKPKMWKTLLGLFNFLYLLHPAVSERTKAVRSQDDITQQPHSPISESFWAGISLGLLGVIVGLSGYWFAAFVQIQPKDMEVVRLPFEMYGLISPIPLGLLPIFLALPAWSSIKGPSFNRQFFLSLLARYAMALTGACLTCPLILIAGAFNQDVLLLFVICVLWHIYVIVFAFGINIAVIFLWMIVRYFQSNRTPALLRGVWALSLFIATIAALISFGFILINNDLVFAGCNLLLSTIIGLTLVLRLMNNTKFSENQQWLIISNYFFVWRVEGSRFKLLLWIISSIFYTLAWFLITSIVFVINHLIFSKYLGDINAALGIFSVAGLGCIILVLIECCGVRKIKFIKRHKIYNLCHCLKLLSNPYCFEGYRKLNKIIASYDLEKISSRPNPSTLTIEEAQEVAYFMLAGNGYSKALDHVSEWILSCQCQNGGFGIWPTSSPRLFSTYQAISILNEQYLLENCNADMHISWIKSLQQPDGGFKGPWSNRDPWQDTYYAAESLNMLGASLEPEKAGLCRNWCSNILTDKGLKADRPDIIYYCFAALTALGTVDEGISKLVADWLSSKIEELLLTNVSLDYENVHFAVSIYSLFCGSINIPEESISLLSERIQTALKAELADIRI